MYAPRLRQILLNLVANAVKFTETGSVRVKIDRAADGVRFRVVDTGIGLTREQSARLFARFAQADPSISRTYGGTGLGLAICHKLVTLMGGAIAVDSEQGRGSTFTFTIPLAIAPAVGADDRPPAATGRILLIEDHDAIREIVVSVLSPLGYAVEMAENGLIGLERARLAAFDLILVDSQMPVMDGAAATRAIRALGGAHVSTPIVAITAHTDRGRLAALADAGVDACLGKPIDIRTLIQTVARFAGARQDASAVAPEKKRDLR